MKIKIWMIPIFCQEDNDLYYKYDLDRQINIFNSILSGVKTDEEIEKENNILLDTNSN